MRQKKQAGLIVFSIVLLLFIVGCGRGEEGISKDAPFLGGNKGLEINFLKDEPPSEITDRGIFPFKVVLSIKNEGEFDLTNDDVLVDLKGILASDFGNILPVDLLDQKPDNNDDPLARKKDSEGNIIEPVVTFVTIPKNNNLNLGIDKIKGNTEFRFRAEVCYRYGTTAIAKICILENMISPADDALCNPRGNKKVFSSSSPVQVTGLRQTVAGENKIQFSFDIEHVGSGKVFQNVPLSSTEGCPKTLAKRRGEENLVNVMVKTLLGQNALSCVQLTTSADDAHGDLRLVNGKRTVTCTQEIGSAFKIDLQRNVDIELRFDYFDKVDRVVLAKHLEVATTTTTTTTGAPPPIIGLKTCGASDAPALTQCIPKTSSFTQCTNLQSCNDASSLCKCTSPSLFVPCTGACTSVTGGDVTGPNIGGRIHPDFAVSSVDQFFVVNDVSDPSGVVSCKLLDYEDTEFFMSAQGPSGCFPGNPCDFIGSVKLEGNGPLRVVCVDGNGNENADKKTRNIVVKQQITQADQLIGIDVTDVGAGKGPKYGDIVSDIVVRDVNTWVVVTGVHDPESGIVQCTLTPPITLDQSTIGTQILEGPKFGGNTQCFGQKADNFHMPCTISHLIKIPSEMAGGGTPAYKLTCINGADQSSELFVPILLR